LIGYTYIQILDIGYKISGLGDGLHKSESNIHHNKVVVPQYFFTVFNYMIEM